MKHTKRTFCLFLTLFIAVSFLSGLFLTLEHDCTHESCQICSFVSSTEKLLGALCLALAAYGFSAIPYVCGGFPPNNPSTLPSATSPVTLKVKLSN
jgi:hypothetical protein